MRLNSAGVLRGCFVPRMVIAASGGVLSIRNRANLIFGLGGGAALVSGNGSGRGDSFGLAVTTGVDVSGGAFAISESCFAGSESCFAIWGGGCGASEEGFGGSADCFATSEGCFGGAADCLGTSDGFRASVDSADCLAIS